MVVGARDDGSGAIGVGLRAGAGRRGGGTGILRKDLLIRGLQFGDLAHHLVLTGCELLDGFSHAGKLPLDGLSHRGDLRLYLL